MVLGLQQLGRNLISTHPVSEVSRKSFVNYPDKACLGIGDEQCIDFKWASSEIYEVESQRLSKWIRKEFFVRSTLTRNTMKIYKLLGHPSEEITKKTARKVSIVLTCEFRSCVGCSKANAGRHALPKTTNSRATKQAERSFVELAGGSHVPDLG